jgi:hypothetical protein
MFNIDLPLLNYYNVTALRMYWTFTEQASPKFPRTPGYAYRIWDRYKLYFPHEPSDFKFRNDYDERHLEGFCQLRYDSDILIITKALKDVMFFRSLGFEAVAPRGEHTVIPDNFIELFKSRYKHVVVFFDNDGKHKGPEYVQRHNLPLLELPKSLAKDPTDYCKVAGSHATEEIILNLLYDKIGTRTFIRSYIPR